MNGTVNGQPANMVQQQAQPVPAEEVQAVVNELTLQRNMMADRATNLSIQLQAATREVERLRNETGGLQARVATLEQEAKLSEAKLVEAQMAATNAARPEGAAAAN